MNIKEKISNDIDIPQTLIEEALSTSRKHVKIFNIKKNGVGYRKICHPSKKLKTIQYWLIHNIFQKLPIHSSAIAFREGLSILHNAKFHCKNRFFLKMDLKDFFPSIKYTDVIPFVEKWHQKSGVIWNLDWDAKEIIRKSCFYKSDQLTVGYPSSPIISNVVMYDFDTRVNGLISDRRFGNMLYTRYADDLVFSTDKKGACKEIKTEMINLISEFKIPDISVNHSKTKLGSSTGGSASVTGLRICPKGHVTIHRKQKDHIRLLLSLYTKGKLKEEEHGSLLGHLAYCHYVAPSFYTSLSGKYFNEIHKLRSENV